MGGRGRGWAAGDGAPRALWYVSKGVGWFRLVCWAWLVLCWVIRVISVRTEGVVERLEWLGLRSSRLRAKRRRLDLEKPSFVKVATDEGGDACARGESLANLLRGAARRAGAGGGGR